MPDDPSALPGETGGAHWNQKGEIGGSSEIRHGFRHRHHYFAWGGADGKTLYLTAQTGLYRIRLNAGTVTHSTKDGKDVLTLSEDFKVPDTPDPHWQIVDSKGNTYLLQRLGAKSLAGLAKDRINMSITLPAYIKDVAKVQIYCAWAEAVLGEAPFSAPLMTMNK
jgi:hypothetical protein